MLLPFFSERDSDILYGESTRDPLGLLPIWSTVGHALIPGLASVVSRIDGIQGILFIYACMDELSANANRKVAADKVLRFLERLWEYHLHQVSDRGPCFGITSLNGADFQLSTSRAGTVGTGLRQYYRGTCVNKKIMKADLKTLTEPYAGYAKALLDAHLINWLKLHVRKMDLPDYSISASVEYEKVRDSLQRFSRGHDALWQSLDDHIINDDGQMPWIEHVVARHNDWAKLPVPSLVKAVQEYSDQQENQRLEQKCQRILDCEPFIQLLEVVFLMAQEEGRSSLPALGEKLAETAPDHLADVCENFQRISFRSRRLDSLKVLANQLVRGDYRGFLSTFLGSYYGSVCKERGKNPIVYVDGPDLIALKPGKTGNTWAKPADPDNWNGYFLKSQISLYVDLKARREATNG